MEQVINNFKKNFICVAALLNYFAYPSFACHAANKYHLTLNSIYSWVESDLSEIGREINEQATRRSLAIERVLEETDIKLISVIEKNNVGEGIEDRKTKNRSPIDVIAIRDELFRRRECDRFMHENIRLQLPATRQETTIVSAILDSEICIIAGATGSGKSTQVPQLLLRDLLNENSAIGATDTTAIKIIVTEPRRVAAISVSERVSDELGDTDRATALCGYTVRLDSNMGPKCVLEYVTIGVLLRRIQESKGRCLNEFSHIFVDEVHERSVDSDLLLLLLREYKARTQLHGDIVTTFPRVVLMSATADVEFISEYWSEVTSKIRQVSIEGRTFPVEALYLEDAIEQSGFDFPGSELSRKSATSAQGQLYSPRTLNVLSKIDSWSINYDIIFHVLKHEILSRKMHSGASRNGAIIVFMPGLDEINRIIGMIESDRDLSSICVPLPMHSSLSSEDLKRAFKKVDSRKCKCVVSTNICETGVTIEDVDLVIDTGFVKSVMWNEVTETSRLRLHLCSVAEATQRGGRAGRVRPGRCIHLFSREKILPGFEGVEGRLKLRPEPEMKRAPLTSPILSLTDQAFGPSLLLSAPGNTVSIVKLTNAINTLVELGALIEISSKVTTSGKQVTQIAGDDESSVLLQLYTPTALGRALALLPCDPRSGKVLLAAYHLNCLHAAAVFIASLDTKSIFIRGRQSDVFFKSNFGKKTESDAVSVVNAYSKWKSIVTNNSSYEVNSTTNTVKKIKSNSSQKYRWCEENGISMPAMLQLSEVASDLIQAIRSITKKSETKISSSSDEIDIMTNDFHLSVSTGTKSEKKSLICLTCSTNVGMHSCITGGTREALHAAITAGMGCNVSFRSTPIESENPKYLSGNKSSVYCRVHKGSLATRPGEYVVYCNQMISPSGVHSLINVISIDMITMLLFSPWTKYFLAEGTVIIGRGIGVKICIQTLIALRKLRAEWEDLLISNNSSLTSICDSRRSQQLVSLLLNLIDTGVYFS